MKADQHPEPAARATEAIVFTAALFGVTLILVVASFRLAGSSGMVPRIVGVPLAALLGYRLLREMLGRPSASTVGDRGRTGDRPGEVRAVLWLLALPVLATVLGFVVGPTLYVFAWTRFRAAERMPVAVLAAAFTALAILGLFSGLLSAPLPQGLLALLSGR